VRWVVLLAFAVAVLVVGCGSGSSRTAKTGCVPAARQQGALSRSQADTAAMWRVARLPGSHLTAIRRLTDRFLADAVDVPPLRRNRLIDVAVGAAAAASCPDCFQALEASRPIPSLKYSNPHCG
jgi:uncharacterized protein YceK